MATLYFGTTLINQADAKVATVVESLTKAEYEALAVKDPNTLYVLTDVENNAEALDSHIANYSNPHGVTAAQVGAPTVAEMNAAILAIPTPDVSGQINTHNADTSAHNDIRTAVSNAASVASAAQTAANNAASEASKAQDAASEAKTIANGKEAAGTAANAVSAHNSATDAHSDIRELIANKKGAQVYTATIGTSWTENQDTGVKSQNVAISGVTANNTAKVDHAYTGNGTSDGYAAFVTEENQYLEFITNGYAETYDGGITFYIFGDPNTVNIPIVVEVV